MKRSRFTEEQITYALRLGEPAACGSAHLGAQSTNRKRAFVHLESDHDV